MGDQLFIDHLPNTWYPIRIGSTESSGAALHGRQSRSTGWYVESIFRLLRLLYMEGTTPMNAWQVVPQMNFYSSGSNQYSRRLYCSSNRFVFLSSKCSEWWLIISPIRFD